MAQEDKNTPTPEVLIGEGPALLALHADGVAHVRLNRPDAANGLDMAMLKGLHEVMTAVHGDGRVRAVLITGEGRNFCAGGDVHTFLSKGGFADNDLVMINGGISDVIANMAAVNAGTITTEQMITASRQAGTDFAAQIRRLVNAGAKYVVVAGTYDLSKTPWATDIGRTTVLNSASSAFNEGLLVGIVDLGANVLYVDLAYYVNLYTSSPSAYGFENATKAVCTSVDATDGIGIGAGKVNSALCTTSTLLASANQDKYAFADSVYLTPSAQRQFGTYAYDRLRSRW